VGHGQFLTRLLSQYQALLDIATSLSLNKLFGLAQAGSGANAHRWRGRDTPARRSTGGQWWPRRGGAGRWRARTRGVEGPGVWRWDQRDAGDGAGAGAAGGACGWVARGAPGRTEQPLAPDTGERGWGGARATRYRSPVPVKRSVRLLVREMLR
jgi:hypothetical protein